MKKTRKVAARVTALILSVISVTANIPFLNAGAYISKGSWSVNVVKSQPQVPGQHSTDHCEMPAYSGGYKTYCSSFTGTNGCDVMVVSNLRPNVFAQFLHWYIYSTGYSASQVSTVGGTAKFDFYAETTDALVASGTIGYDI